MNPSLEIIQYLISHCITCNSPLQVVIMCYRLHRIGAEFIINDTKLRRKLLLYLNTLSPTDRLYFMREFALLDGLVDNKPSTSNTIPNPLHLYKTNTHTEDQFTSFSNSRIWSMQNSYYSRSQLDAWNSNDVPFEVSSNRFVANMYVEEIQSMWKMVSRGPPSICIVEIGAGHGILSYYIAEEISRRRWGESMAICTDFHDSVFKDLLHLPWFSELCDKRYLDFATFRASAVPTDKPEMRLLHSGGCIPNGCLHWDMVVVVANYAFDSFPVDIVATTTNGTDLEVGIYNESTNDCSPAAVLRKAGLRSLRNSTSSSDTKTKLLRRMKKTAGGCGVHAVPVAACAALEQIRGLFKDCKHFGLIVGDCFMSHDDSRWQGTMIDSLSESGDCSGVCGIARWFDPPFISPVQEAVALPVSAAGVTSAFYEICGCMPIKSSCSPLIGSDFSVISMLAPLTSIPREVEVQRFTLALNSESFGPSDLSTLRHLMTSQTGCTPELSLSCVASLMELSCNDWGVFLSMRWIVRRMIALECSQLCTRFADMSSENQLPPCKKAKVIHPPTTCNCTICVEVLKWITCCICSFRGYCFTSWKEYILIRLMAVEWLVALMSATKFHDTMVGKCCAEIIKLFTNFYSENMYCPPVEIFPSIVVGVENISLGDDFNTNSGCVCYLYSVQEGRLLVEALRRSGLNSALSQVLNDLMTKFGPEDVVPQQFRKSILYQRKRVSVFMKKEKRRARKIRSIWNNLQ